MGLRFLCVRFKFWFVFDFVSPSAVKIRQCGSDSLALASDLSGVFSSSAFRCCCKFNTSATQKTHQNVINYKATLIAGMGKAAKKELSMVQYKRLYISNGQHLIQVGLGLRLGGWGVRALIIGMCVTSWPKRNTIKADYTMR